MLFGDNVSVRQLLGVVSTFGGIVLYTHFKMEEKNDEGQKHVLPKNSVKLQRV